MRLALVLLRPLPLVRDGLASAQYRECARHLDSRKDVSARAQGDRLSTRRELLVVASRVGKQGQRQAGSESIIVSAPYGTSRRLTPSFGVVIGECGR